MPQEPVESIQVDLESTEQFYRHDISEVIRRDKARTANLLAMVLVVGVVLSLPLYFVAVWLVPDGGDRLAVVFDKWYAIISPLTGTAIGAYYGARFERSSSGVG
jgi:hypothetical protein